LLQIWGFVLSWQSLTSYHFSTRGRASLKAGVDIHSASDCLGQPPHPLVACLGS